MKNQTLSGLVSILFFGFATAAWADMTIPCAGCPAQLTGDVTLAVGGKLTLSEAIDLKGRRLVLTGVSGMEGDYSITDTTGGGVLDIEVTRDTTQTGSFGGKLKFIKRGNGKFITVEKQTYSGGTEIVEGMLEHSGSKYSLDATVSTKDKNPTLRPFGDVTGAIVICKDGKLSLKGMINWGDKYPITLHGGELTNAQTRTTGYFSASTVTLSAGSIFSTSAAYGLSAKMDLGSNDLTVLADAALNFKPVLSDGKVIVKGKGLVTLTDNVSMPTVSLKVEKQINLAGHTLTVKDYEAANGDSISEMTGVLAVGGVFTPVSDNFCPCTLMNGSTIDLSGKASTWSLSNAAGAAAQFAAGATVTIDLGTRAIAAGDKIVDWPDGAEYAGRTFVLKTNGVVSEEFELQVSATGLTVAARGAKVPTATWTGAVSADATNPDNWSWANVPEPTPGLTPGGSLNLTPGPTTAVVIPWEKLATISWPDTADLSFATIEFAGEKPTETVVLDDDRDWRGLGPMDIPFALDLDGHKLYLVLPGAASANETTVTSSVEGGELHATVATDKVHDNTSVALTGNLTLIKEGPGTFVQTLAAQSYSGETRVLEGVLATASGDMSAEGVSLFGAAKSVTVAAGGALDPRGSYNWSDYTIVLAGGVISNTVEEVGSSAGNKTAYNISDSGFNRRFNPNVTLLEDSTFATTKTYTFFATVDSNGYDLQNWIAADAEVRWQPKTKTGGNPLTMDITGGGELFILKAFSLDQPTMTLKMSDGWVTMGGDMVVSNYVAASKLDSFDYKNTNAVMKVWGTFTPETQNFIGCTLQDGSNIDLSKQNGVWNSRGYTKLNKDGKNTVKGDIDFADGATVTIDVGGREFKGVEQIVAWSEGSKTSAAGATFVLNAAAKAKGYCLTRDANGLSVGRKGLVLIIQ